MNKYAYLKKYIGPHKYPVKTWCENSFLSVSDHDIKEAEIRLGCEFPKTLKEFWHNIGYGNLTTTHNPPDNYECFHKNDILSPNQIADIIILKEESHYILPEAVEWLEEGDIPFFEIGDSTDFLVMKPDSEDPDYIYYIFGGEVIEKSFERFIWRLYHESPTFYMANWGTEEKKPTQEELLRGTPARGELWKYVNHNYHKMFRAMGIYDEFWRGGEPAALEMIQKFPEEIFINKCPHCGNIKATPKARQCLKCGVFTDPVH